MSCYKQKSSLTYRNLQGFTCLPKEHGQTEWEGAKENTNRSQGFTEYFSFHCWPSFVVVVTVVVFIFFLFVNKCMHTQTPFLCLLLSCPWLHWASLGIRYSRKNPAKALLTRTKLDFIFLLNDGLPSSPCLWASGELTGWYWLFNYVCSFFFFWPRTKIWASSFRSEVFKTCHIISCCLQNLFQLVTNKLNTISFFFPAAEPNWFPRLFLKRFHFMF